MARKKQEIALQAEIETQEEWEEMLSKEGLTVVDVYQDWCGPCKAMVGQLKRVKNEVGDDLLHFSVAKADTVDALEKYRGKCEPCFLFFAGGVLVAVVRGANSPLVTRTITEQLAQEHKVLDGDTERKEIRDPMLGEADIVEKGAADAEEQEKADEDMEPVKKGVTVAIIKPDAVKAGKVDEIIEKMKESGIEILKHEERNLTDEEAREFYRHLQDEPFFDNLVEFMCSGPSHVLVITKGETGENIVDEWRELLGPKQVEEAKEAAPDSLRAQYGESELMNALHGSDTQERAMAELAFFFPDYNVPAIPGTGPKPKIERTLALIRPDAAREHKDAILAKIKEAGFQIALMKEMEITKEQAEEFYSEHKGQPYFEELTTTMSSGPLIALGLAREQAVTAWRDMLGPKEVEKKGEEGESEEEKSAEQTPPAEGEAENSEEKPADEQAEKPADEQAEKPEGESDEQTADGEKKEEVAEGEEQKALRNLRAQFSIEGSNINPLHGSDSAETAKKELEFFFPMQKTMAVIKPDAYQTKEEIMNKIREAGFHIAAKKETQVTKEIAETLYKDCVDKEYYNDITDHMASGTTLFMVITREDAVEGWRGLIGPTDPEQAKEAAPGSIRAQFGQDIKANAVHGPSNLNQAEEEIKAIFGDIEINSDGTLKEPPPAEGAGQGEESEYSEEDFELDELSDGQMLGKLPEEVAEPETQITQIEPAPTDDSSSTAETKVESERPPTSTSDDTEGGGDKEKQSGIMFMPAQRADDEKFDEQEDVGLPAEKAGSVVEEEELKKAEEIIEEGEMPIGEAETPMKKVEIPVDEVEPAGKAGGSLEELKQPMEELSQPIEEAEQSKEELGEPIEDLAEPIEEPAEPLGEPAEPIEEPAEPIEEPAESLGEPAESLGELVEPIEESAETIEEPGDPQEEGEEEAIQMTSPSDADEVLPDSGSELKLEESGFVQNDANGLVTESAGDVEETIQEVNQSAQSMDTSDYTMTTTTEGETAEAKDGEKPPEAAAETEGAGEAEGTDQQQAPTEGDEQAAPTGETEAEKQEETGQTEAGETEATDQPEPAEGEAENEDKPATSPTGSAEEKAEGEETEKENKEGEAEVTETAEGDKPESPAADEAPADTDKPADDTQPAADDEKPAADDGEPATDQSDKPADETEKTEDTAVDGPKSSDEGTTEDKPAE